MPQPDGEQPLSKEHAQRSFREAMHAGSYLLTDHARKRMRERDITTNDLLTLARTGIVLRDPERHPVTNDWTYQIECKSPDIRAVYAVEECRWIRIRVITVIDKA
jgi:hypothetical protein